MIFLKLLFRFIVYEQYIFFVLFFLLAYMFGCSEDGRFLYRAWLEILCSRCSFAHLRNFDWPGGICCGQRTLEPFAHQDRRLGGHRLLTG